MKKWFMLLFLIGGTALTFAQYGSSLGQNYNLYKSGSTSSDGQQQQIPSNSPCENLKNTNPEAYAFSQQLSPIHQNVFCQQFNRAQQQQAMALAGSPTQDLDGQGGLITPDMAVEVVLQTARYSQNNQNQTQQQPSTYSNQPEPYPYSKQSQSDNRSGRYSNY